MQTLPELCRAESEQGFDRRALQEYILICCQQRDGGLCALYRAERLKVASCDDAVGVTRLWQAGQARQGARLLPHVLLPLGARVRTDEPYR